MNKIFNLLGLMQRAGKLITGEDLIVKNLKNRKIKLLIIATDCGVNTKKKLEDKANFYKVEYINFSNIESISTAIGRNNRVAIGVIDEGFVKKFRQLLEEGGNN